MTLFLSTSRSAVVKSKNLIYLEPQPSAISLVQPSVEKKERLLLRIMTAGGFFLLLIFFLIFIFLQGGLGLLLLFSSRWQQRSLASPASSGAGCDCGRKT